MGIYVKGLSEQLKNELASRDEPSLLEELISRSIGIDNRLRERIRERAGKQRSVGPPVAPSTPLSHFPPASPTPPPCTEEDLMQLRRVHLKLLEQQRMLQRLCLYCGKAGRYIDSCPLSRKE